MNQLEGPEVDGPPATSEIACEQRRRMADPRVLDISHSPPRSSRPDQRSREWPAIRGEVAKAARRAGLRVSREAELQGGARLELEWPWRSANLHHQAREQCDDWVQRPRSPQTLGALCSCRRLRSWWYSTTPYAQKRDGRIQRRSATGSGADCTFWVAFRRDSRLVAQWE